MVFNDTARRVLQKKCDMYWPQEGTETFGVIRVTNLGQDVMATYTIRKFRIQHLKVNPNPAPLTDGRLERR